MLGRYRQQAVDMDFDSKPSRTVWGLSGKALEELPALAYRSENGVVKKIVGSRISIETPAFDGVLTEVQSARTREFRWFIGLWAKFFSQGLLWSPRTDVAEQSFNPARGGSHPNAQTMERTSNELKLKIL
jgi:hypothetical protein